ncbi:MAG: TetR/AcrR family transcriptional regulator [Deltaproteobacteria bacterium]|nr:TetR/AcrR family transcriptional regulator [Deltaproteobacteria bacterium]
MAKNDKQEMIIDAALEVFCEKGYANTRMADIAKKAGVSYGLVYHYFESKEAFFDNIVEKWWNTLYEMLENQRQSDAELKEKLANIIRFFLDTYSNRFFLLSIFITEVSRSSLYRTERGLMRFRKFFTMCDEIMSDAQKKGILRKDVPPHYMTYIFLGAMEAFISVMVLGKEKLNRQRAERTINAIIRIFLCGAMTAAAGETGGTIDKDLCRE